MSTLIPVEAIAEALAMHQKRYDARGCNDGCLCGAEVFHRDFAAHQASVIAALPDIAVVSLPKGTVREFGGLAWGADEDGEYPTVTATPGCDTVRLYVEDARHTSEGAFGVAGFLLAAARAAGGKQ